MKVSLLLLLVVSSVYSTPDSLPFPEGFLFGVSTAAYQVEGGWNQDGKGENIWDHQLHTNSNITIDHSNGDVACDSYNRIKRDVDILNNLDVDHYRFSISWSRILPTGLDDNINEAGVNYYKKLINELKIVGIQPMVTLLHFDLPQKLQDMGGFLNESIVDWFGNYSRVAYRLFGDDVKFWITINEPLTICYYGYGTGAVPPFIQSEGILEYQCLRNLLKAHARAYHVYAEEFRNKQQGKLSMSFNTNAFLPGSDNPKDIEATERVQQFNLGVYAHPIFVGDWPEIVKTRVAIRSKLEGRNESRLPAFTPEEIDYIKGTADFLGLNTYTAQLVLDTGEEPPLGDHPTKEHDALITTFQDDKWEDTNVPTVKVVPQSIKPLLKWIKDQYNNPGVFITENGYPSPAGDMYLKDDRRVHYIESYLRYIRESMEEDEVSMLGYTVWSLMDNFEWIFGYTVKYGLYDVDFTSPDLTRAAKPSAQYYKEVILTRCATIVGCFND
ncbi:myrosinase 1-like isoform X1 [Diabrotica virgifera virgifera]|uniref:Myrosinase 1-like n=1 Tax=Diabrotica virgifera virgifera TaxID=50390 RepID=A0ABM5JXU6_DIAVI|nr:myrosinase 1-like isoform X1 [Diabrotica virgifera virgifera]